MSNALAIAAVSHLLKDLLNDGIIQGDLGATVGAKVVVTSRPPIRQPDTSNPDECQLNLFLYQVQPNSGWRNEGLPARDAQGTRVGRHPLALDLHYLLTAYDERDLHPEILLGYGMQLLHETPVLGRKLIRRSLRDIAESGTGTLPPNLKALTQSGLADQMESIRITPNYLNTEELSKIWTGFQAPYRLSMAYIVTVVLIEVTEPVRQALPVLTMGAENRGPSVLAGMLPALPTLLAARAEGYQSSARHDGTIHLLGHHLEGTGPRVIIKHPGLALELFVANGGVTLTPPPTSAELADGTESFTLPDDIRLNCDRRVRVDLSQAQLPADWVPGHHTVELEVTQLDEQGSPVVRRTNALPLTIAPLMVLGDPTIPVDPDHPTVLAAAAANGTRSTTVRLRCRPGVRKGQEISLFLGDRELAGAGVFGGSAIQTDTLEFQGDLPEFLFVPSSAPPALHPVRLRVDGVESPFILRFPAPKPPQFDSGQRIRMPT